MADYNDFAVDTWIGSTVSLSLAMIQPPANTPINVTGGSFWVTGKTDPNSQADLAALFQLAIGTGVTVTDAANGKATAVIPSSASVALGATTLVYVDVKYKDSVGNESEAATGTINFKRGVTRAT